jgi:diguanylate cyclase (GGDEF)-like protein
MEQGESTWRALLSGGITRGFEQEKAIKDFTRENTMMIKRTSLLNLRDEITSVAPSLDSYPLNLRNYLSESWDMSYNRTLLRWIRNFKYAWLDIKESSEEIITSLLLSTNNPGDPAALAVENILLREKSRRSEEELEKARSELELKVMERTFELMETNRRLKELSITDGLTGLFNQRYFLLELEKECRKALRYERSLALLLLDIDHFKAVNDRYGHPCGDHVLKNVAALLKGCLRNSDIAARCGGDELAIILPETNKPKASKVAEKLRRQLGKNSFTWNGDSFGITCSIGVAAVPDMGIDNWNALLESADKSLYRSKREGRHSVVAINSRRIQSVPKGRQCRRQQVLPIH